MAFSSVTFLFLFLPTVYLLYLILLRPGGKNALLLVASLVFYSWGEGIYVLLMLISALANWGFGLMMGHWHRHRKGILVAAVVFNLGLLAFFKYFGMLLDMTGFFIGWPISLTVPHLPIGISFFTFQALSYVVDVSRNPGGVQKNFFKVLLFISFFPQLVAGPIVKYHDIAPQLDRRDVSIDKTAAGIRRFICGLSKKLLVADVMATVADDIFANPASYGIGAVAWIGAIAYMLQIYFDFSGYSDMAIGLGGMFGFTFHENFRYPYGAKGIQDFWRKWHISLSTWFRDYLYIPLGGNRRGKLRTCGNLMLVFFLTGLWHGASYTFVVWGLYHGMLLTLERLGILRIIKGKGAFLTHIYTVFAVMVGFVIFRAESLSQAWQYLGSMFDLGSLSEGVSQALVYMNPYLMFTFCTAVVISMPILPVVKRRFESLSGVGKTVVRGISYAGSLLLFLCCVMAVASNAYSPFIYFRF